MSPNCHPPLENQLQTIARLVASSRDSHAGQRHLPERRNFRRVPYNRILSVTPATRDGRQSTGESLVAFGKEVSFRGLDFYHREPLTHRHVIVSAIGPDEAETTMLLELTRCQFMADGRYASGGRFLRFMQQPGNDETIGK